MRSRRSKAENATKMLDKNSKTKDLSFALEISM